MGYDQNDVFVVVRHLHVEYDGAVLYLESS